MDEPDMTGSRRGGIPVRVLRPLAACLAAVAAATSAPAGTGTVGAAPSPPPSVVQFSDGASLTGRVSLTAGADVRIHDGRSLHVVPLGGLAEIRCEPERETMERKWRFAEAGQTRKEFWGEPYPVRDLRATAVLADGASVTGHLYTTVLYVETPDGVEKVRLMAKQRGREGQTFNDLVYPVRIAVREVTGATPRSLPIEAPAGAQVAVLTRPALVRFDASARASGGFTVPSTCGGEVFTAVREGETVRVAWPATAMSDTNTAARVEQAMASVRDFFDTHRTVACWVDGEDVYTLLLLSRTGGTTLGGARQHPWRIEIWRWRAADDGRMMIAGRGYLFRGIGAKDAPLPRVAVDPLTQ